MLGFISVLFSIVFLVVPIAMSIRLICKSDQTGMSWLASALSAAIICYFFLMLSVQTTEKQFECELASFDLDRDGSFSGNEITPEMEIAMKNLTNDTGRTFTPFTGLITCPIYSAFWHLVIGGPYLLFRRLVGALAAAGRK